VDDDDRPFRQLRATTPMTMSINSVMTKPVVDVVGTGAVIGGGVRVAVGVVVAVGVEVGVGVGSGKQTHGEVPMFEH
jgi:hypothetical protein